MSLRAAALSLFLLPSTLAAQDYSQCPAPVQPGEWAMIQTNAMAIIELMSPKGGLTLVQPSRNDPQTATVTATCDSGFILSGVTEDGVILDFEMELVDWLAPVGPRYRGELSAQGLMLKMDARIATPRSGASQTEILGSDGFTTLRALPYGVMESRAQEGAPHYACTCRDQLENHIAERIEDLTKIRDTYADDRFHTAPPGYDGLPWDIWAYDYLVGLHLTYPGRSLAELGAKLLEDDLAGGVRRYEGEEDQPGGPPTASGEAGEAGIRGWTDKNCNITVTDQHRRTCFPDIERESISKHEAVHAKSCADMRDGKAAEPGPFREVVAHAAEEVEAYNVELDYLRGFVAEKCGR